MYYTVYKKFDVASAHQIKGHPKCGKLHGHNYLFEVWITAPRLDKQYGFVLDFAAFKEIHAKYDHSDVVITISSEELAKETADTLYNMIDEDFRKETTIKVRIWESDHTYAEYIMSKVAEMDYK